MTSRFHIALASVSLIGLGGCLQSPENIAYANRMHTQIQAAEVTAELKIDTVVSGEKLGSSERDAVKYFAAAYQNEGHGAVIISRPSNGPDDVSALRAAADARAIMLAEGPARPDQLAGSISQALITTAAGLCVAIPSYMFHRMFMRRVETLVLGLEQESVKLVDALHSDRRVENRESAGS